MHGMLHVMAESAREAYVDGEEDEQMLPRVLVDVDGKPIGRVANGDPVIFYDIRGEREVQLTRAFIEPDFPHFDTKGRVSRFTTMIEYHSSLNVGVMFPPEDEVKGSLCEAINNSGRKLSKVVESEKAIHLSYFLGGKREEPFECEKRVIIESPKDVSNYDEKPEMAASEVADKTIEEIFGDANVIIVNFANVDVVGHIEDRDAVIKAVETVDRELGRVLIASAEAMVPAVVTADHGTVEKWLYPDGKVDTGHTNSEVPFIIVDERLKGRTLRSGRALTDVAPTLLSILGIEAPEQMTGTSLLKGEPPEPTERIVFIILDGWGYSDDDYGNLIKVANTPTMDRIISEYPSTNIAASGVAVGMPEGKVGNSEAGHLHIGAGRVILSSSSLIDKAMEDGSFLKNPAMNEAMDIAMNEARPLHLLGIVSFYSSHGSVDHLYAILKAAKERGVTTVYHHALLGRRGERPEAGAAYIDDVERFCEKLGLGRVVTVMGRFWALDREENWDRVDKAYRAIVDGVGIAVKDTSNR
jgi:2,3-bisphosphoglycerate-independent phosphoglycerate mutase